MVSPALPIKCFVLSVFSRSCHQVFKKVNGMVLFIRAHMRNDNIQGRRSANPRP